jgi:hypothetical protein
MEELVSLVMGLPPFFAAVRLSAYGTKRTYQDVRLLVRFRAKADMHNGAALAASVAFDPKRT